MAVEQEAGASICPACGESFVCGAVAGLETCWCMEKPTAFFDPDTGGRCFCPACLDKRISEQSSPAT